MEKSDPTVSLDLLVKSLLAMGADKKSIPRAIVWRDSMGKNMNTTPTFFFTADEHYGHTNIIKYCERPYASVGEMDAEIIKRHNDLICDYAAGTVQ